MKNLTYRINCLCILLLLLATCCMPTHAQGLPTDGPLTVRPLLQQLAQRLL